MDGPVQQREDNVDKLLSSKCIHLHYTLTYTWADEGLEPPTREAKENMDVDRPLNLSITT